MDNFDIFMLFLEISLSLMRFPVTFYSILLQYLLRVSHNKHSNQDYMAYLIPFYNICRCLPEEATLWQKFIFSGWGKNTLLAFVIVSTRSIIANTQSSHIHENHSLSQVLNVLKFLPKMKKVLEKSSNLLISSICISIILQRWKTQQSEYIIEAKSQ